LFLYADAETFKNYKSQSKNNIEKTLYEGNIIAVEDFIRRLKTLIDSY